MIVATDPVLLPASGNRVRDLPSHVATVVPISYAVYVVNAANAANSISCIYLYLHIWLLSVSPFVLSLCIYLLYRYLMCLIGSLNTF